MLTVLNRAFCFRESNKGQDIGSTAFLRAVIGKQVYHKTDLGAECAASTALHGTRNIGI